MKAIRYNPTGEATPRPRHLKKLIVGRWVPVTEALPPERVAVLVQMRGDDTPAYAWLKFAAGDKTCPHFICPQGAAIAPRNCHLGKPPHAKHRQDVTHWYAPTVNGLPHPPEGFEDAEWGLGGCGWETRDEPLNPQLDRPL